MSTSGNVLFIKNCVIESRRIRDIEEHAFLNMYSHFDSYPEYLGDNLIKAINIVKEGGRIEDIDYATMCIVNYIVDKNRDKIVKGDLTGFGISTECADGIEFLYIVNMNMRYIMGYEIDFERDWELGNKVLEYHF